MISQSKEPFVQPDGGAKYIAGAIASHYIDTTSRQMGVCPNCFAEMDYNLLRNHISKSCPERRIVCIDCNLAFSERFLKDHIAKECPAAKRRRGMVQRAILRKQFPESTLVDTNSTDVSSVDVHSGIDTNDINLQLNESNNRNNDDNVSTMAICNQCNTATRKSQLSHHLKCECRMRLIYCPNKSLGCPVEVAISSIPHHLAAECIVESRKAELIEKSQLRSEFLPCTGCGELQMLRNLKKHEIEKCVNRKVPCRNQCLGCGVMVRFKERAKHEHVDGLRATRRCLALNGEGGHLRINEDDITSSWTCEFWIFRPSAQDAAKCALRRLGKLCQDFNTAFAIEQQTARLVSLHIACLNDAKANDPIPHLASSDPNQSQVEKRKAVVNRLQQLVVVYEDAMLATCSAAQLLGIALSGAQEALAEIQDQFSGYATELVSLQPTGTCEADLEQAEEMERKRLQDEVEKREREQAMLDRFMKLKMKDTKTHSNDNSVDTPEGDQLAIEEEEEASSSSRKNIRTVINEGDEDQEDIGNANADDTAPTDDNPVEDNNQPNEIDENNSPREEEKNQTNEFSEEKEKDELEEDDEQLLPEVAEMDEAFLQSLTEYELPNALFLMCKGKEYSAVDSVALGTLFPDYHRHKLNPKRSVAEVAQTIDQFELARQYFSLESMRLLYIRFQRKDKYGRPVIDPPRMNFDLKYTWKQWGSMVNCLQFCVNYDLELLHKWRMEANLLEDFLAALSDALGGKAKKAGLTKEQIKAQKKKEKEKKRRELKKLKGNERHATVEEGENDEEAKPSSVSTASAASASKGKLITRVLNMFRSNLGSEVLLSSSSVNSGGGRSRLCAEMYSGFIFDKLNFLARSDKSMLALIKDHTTVSKGRAKSGYKVANSQPAAGLSAASTAVDFSSSTQQGQLKSWTIMNEDYEQGYLGFISNTNSLALNAGAIVKCKVPRMQWCHIAVVSSSHPRNRMQFYKNGSLVGQAKDLATPLPMGFLGEPRIFSYLGSLLDVRLWSKQRSGVEIQRTMHRVIGIEDILNGKITASNPTGESGRDRGKAITKRKRQSTVAGNEDLDGDKAKDQSQDNVTNEEEEESEEDGKSGPQKKQNIGGPRPAAGQQQRQQQLQLKKQTEKMIDLSCKNMIAYWTFEELDTSSVVSDVTLQRFKTPISCSLDPIVYNPPDIDLFVPDLSLKVQQMTKLRLLMTFLKAEARDLVSEIIMKPSTISLLKQGFVWIDTDNLQSSLSTDKNTVTAGSTVADKNKSIDDENDAVVPVPSFNMKNKCQFEIRRFKLAVKGRALQKEVNCPLGCLERVRGLDLRFHVKFDCLRRRVACKFEFCKATFPLQDRSRHEALYCSYVQRRQEVLDEAISNNALQPCEYCGDEVVVRYMDAHLKNECPHRMVKCNNRGCQLTMQAHMIDQHSRFDCESSELKYRYFLVSRARARSEYPRPWGIEFCMEVNSDNETRLSALQLTEMTDDIADL